MQRGVFSLEQKGEAGCAGPKIDPATMPSASGHLCLAAVGSRCKSSALCNRTSAGNSSGKISNSRFVCQVASNCNLLMLTCSKGSSQQV